MHGVGTFRAGIGKGSEQFPFSLVDLCAVDGQSRGTLGMRGGSKAREAPKHEEIGERIASEAIRTMKSGGRLARSEKSGHSGFGGFRVHSDATHHVMARRAHFHGALGDVHVRKFLELVIHAGEFLLHVFSRLVRNVKIRTAMLRAAAILDFCIDGASDHIARGKLHALRIVLFHETLASFVAQDAAFSANGFGAEYALRTAMP